MINSVYSPGSAENFKYVSSVNDSCITFSMNPECTNNSDDAPSTGIQDFNGLVAQSITCSCARQPTIVYEIGSKNYYAVDAKPQGQGRLQNILGPTRQSLESLKTLGDICKQKKITIFTNFTTKYW